MGSHYKAVYQEGNKGADFNTVQLVFFCFDMMNNATSNELISDPL